MKVRKKMRKIGFVIVNYNDAKTTIRLLNQLKEFKNIDSIVVVDNNSTDNSFVQLKEQENGNITIIKNSENKEVSKRFIYTLLIFIVWDFRLTDMFN